MKKINFEIVKNTAKNYNRESLACLQFFFDAHTFVIKNHFIKYLLISGLVFLIFFSMTLKAVLHGIDVLEPVTTDWVITNFKSYINLSVENIKSGIHAAFWLLKTTVSGNNDKIFTMIFLIIGTPYFSYITGKASRIIYGKQTASGKWINEIIRGLKLSSINSLKQLGLLLIITLFSFIPVLGIAAPLLAFITQAYYNGILMTDYALERQGFDMKKSKIFFKTNKPGLFSIGLGFMFLLLIPVIGWFLAPTYALIASSLYLLQKTQ